MTNGKIFGKNRKAMFKMVDPRTVLEGVRKTTNI
jgi:hypothetical protein